MDTSCDRVGREGPVGSQERGATPTLGTAREGIPAKAKATGRWGSAAGEGRAGHLEVELVVLVAIIQVADDLPAVSGCARAFVRGR